MASKLLVGLPYELRQMVYKKLLSSPTGYVQPIVLRDPAANPDLPVFSLEHCDLVPKSILEVYPLCEGQDDSFDHMIDFTILRVNSQAYEEAGPLVQEFFNNTVLFLSINPNCSAQDQDTRYPGRRYTQQSEPRNALYRWPNEKWEYECDGMKVFYRRFKKIEFNFRWASLHRLVEPGMPHGLDNPISPTPFNNCRDIMAAVIDHEDSKLEEVAFVLRPNDLEQIYYELFPKCSWVVGGFYTSLELNFWEHPRWQVAHLFCLMMGYTFTVMTEDHKAELWSLRGAEREARIAEKGFL